MVEEGAPVEVVDQALSDFGMAMGPLATGDLAGLDVGWRIRKEYRHLEKPGVRQPVAEDQLCEMGRYGQKTQAGWYRYDETRCLVLRSARWCESGRRRVVSSSARLQLTRSWIVAFSHWSMRARAFWKKELRCVQSTSTSFTSTVTGFPLIEAAPCGMPMRLASTKSTAAFSSFRTNT